MKTEKKRNRMDSLIALMVSVILKFVVLYFVLHFEICVNYHHCVNYCHLYLLMNLTENQIMRRIQNFDYFDLFYHFGYFGYFGLFVFEYLNVNLLFLLLFRLYRSFLLRHFLHKFLLRLFHVFRWVLGRVRLIESNWDCL